MPAELVEIKTVLATIATTTNFIKDEQQNIRRNQHDLADKLQPLMGIPDQLREVKEQHREFRTKIEDVQSKMGIVQNLTERVGRMEPVVEGLVKDRDQARGAIWGTRVVNIIWTTVISAVVAGLAYLGFIKHPS